MLLLLLLDREESSCPSAVDWTLSVDEAGLGWEMEVHCQMMEEEMMTMVNGRLPDSTTKMSYEEQGICCTQLGLHCGVETRWPATSPCLVAE